MRSTGLAAIRPTTATSWSEHAVQKIIKQKGVKKIVSDMCAFGMYKNDTGIDQLVKKPAAFMTNRAQIAQRLQRRCPGDHRHVGLIGGSRAKRAETKIQRNYAVR